MINSKYIEFIKEGDTGKTEIWNIISKSSKSILGQIKWYGAWRQYCFFPSRSTLFNITCLDDVSLAIRALMNARKTKDGNK